jgi:chloramphenicol O-acetyltransferase type A
MKQIDIQNWSRREHFDFFNTFNHPHFNMCANMDLSAFHSYVKGKDLPMTAAIIYIISRATNAIPEFRQRIRDEQVIEHETVSPSVTILTEGDLFSFCTIDYIQDFSIFADRATARMKAVMERPTLKDPPGRDDLLYMTALPWVSFTAFTHPMKQHPADSIPRFAWGKFFKEQDHLKMPLSVQGHHALMDGLHMGRFYGQVQEYFDNPFSVLGSA